MKTIFKALALTLGFLMMFTLAACNDANSESDNNNEEQETQLNDNDNNDTDESSNKNSDNTHSETIETPIESDGKDFIYENIIVGVGTDWELNGILTLPKNVNYNIPAVVLVHGSGPSDMDETIYENKPFLEIAEYLSSNGIAVIRYDKRTFTYGTEMVQQLGGSLTMYEETIEDAVLASELIKADPRIDENRVYMLGHSMGGSLAPRIHTSGGNFAGLILLAGSPRSLSEIIGDQQTLAYKEMMEAGTLNDFLLANGITSTPEEFVEALDLQDETISAQNTAILNMSDDDAKAVPDGTGATLYYYKDNLLNPASDYIKNITIPFLVMHADNDFQVFKERDFGEYKTLLQGRNNVTFKLYEDLNHLFMPSTITRSLDIQDEYRIKANIDEQVLKDIVDWVKAN